MKVLTYHESFDSIDAVFTLKDVNLEKKKIAEDFTFMEDIIFQTILKRPPPIGSEAYAIWISKYQPRMTRITKCLKRADTCFIYGIRMMKQNSNSRRKKKVDPTRIHESPDVCPV